MAPRATQQSAPAGEGWDEALAAELEIWSGSVSLGLVVVAVRLERAAQSHRQRFRLLHDHDFAPLQRRMRCPVDDAVVHSEHITRGYEVQPGRFVTVSGLELISAAPERSRQIELTAFVDPREIDPIYIDRPYYMVPEGPRRPYRLLAEALARCNKAGLSQFVLHDRQYPVAVRGIEGALCLLLLRFAEQLRPAEAHAVSQQASSHDTADIVRRIQSMERAFHPARYDDAYQQRVDALLARKRQTQGTITPPPAGLVEGAAEPADLAAALRASLRRPLRRGA